MIHFNNSGNDGDDAIQEGLSWRMSPEESPSDWTLIVTTGEGTGVSNEYILHRNVLTVGPCKSDYFMAFFRMPMKEKMTSTSEIELDMDAADVVPLMLDFFFRN